MTTSSSMRVNAGMLLEGERMRRILAVTYPVRTLNVWKRVRVKQLKGSTRELPFYPFNGSTLQLITSTSPSAPGRGIVRNRDCPACKNLRRSVVNPVDARRCAGILSGAGHSQKDALQQFRVGGSIIAQAALRIRSKGGCSVNSELRCHAPPKMEIARFPGCRRHAPRRS